MNHKKLLSILFFIILSNSFIAYAMHVKEKEVHTAPIVVSKKLRCLIFSHELFSNLKKSLAHYVIFARTNKTIYKKMMNSLNIKKFVEYYIEKHPDMPSLENIFTELKNGKCPFIHFLIKSHLNLEKLKDRDGFNILSCILYSKNPYHMKKLIKAHYVLGTFIQPSGLPPLVEAVCTNESAMINFLLQLKVDINQQTENGYTALMMACIKGVEANVKTLLSHGADTTIQNHDGNTAEKFATTQTIKELIKNYKSPQPKKFRTISFKFMHTREIV